MRERTGNDRSVAPPPSRGWRRRVSVGVLVAACAGSLAATLLGGRAPARAEAAPARFPHSRAQHARLPCLLCHQRQDNSPRPTLPGHASCAGCHAPEFANPASPLCALCHTDAASGALAKFPPLRTFDARFDHAKHARGAAAPRGGCATCHTPERRGVALSIPSGADAHATCFRCHGPRAQSRGRDISSCGLCHRVGRFARTSESAKAFRVGFEHAAHTREGLGCGTCHTVRAGAARSKQVTSPFPSQHHAPPGATSCVTCHDDRKAFGGDDFSDCKRCHRGEAWRF